MIGDIITNLSDEELQNEYASFKAVCEDCKVIHQTFRIPTPCAECNNRIIVNGLKRHFENR